MLGLSRLRIGLLSSSASSIGGGGSFSPLSLFASGEQGAWYDPSDLTTMFQDTAGTTPVTAAGQTVGLLLDKSQGLVLGPELVTNSWTRGFLSVDGTILVSGPSVTITQGAGDGSGFRWVQPITCVVGRSYRLSLSNATKVGGTLALAAISSSSSGTGITADNSINDGQVPGQKFIVATATTMYVVISLSGGTTGNSATFTGLSVKELPGNHATQATAASRPIYGIEPFGGRRNLLVRTEEFDNGVWVKTSQGSATAPTITANAGTAPDGTTTAERAQFARTGTTTTDRSRLEQTSIPIATATNYTLSVWMKSFDGTDQTVAIFPNFGAGGGGYVTVTSAWQRFTVTVNSSSSTTAAIVFGLGYFTGSVTAADILIWGAQLETGSTATAYQRVTDQWNVTQAGVPSVSYIQCDGTDDFMLTGTITPGIDKAQVFAGVRKLSDAAEACLVETSIATSAINGSVGIFAPGTSSGSQAGKYFFASRGTIRSFVEPTGYAAPITNVLTGIGDIAGDVATLRVNGTQAATSSADQGTGNYTAQPMYIGRRAGTTFAFNGRIYQMLVRFGANLSAATITQTETFVNSRTGAY